MKQHYKIIIHMRNRLIYPCVFALVASLAFQRLSAQTDTICVADFGVRPYSYENSVTQIQQAINACKAQGAKVLKFPKGRIDIWPEGAVRKEYFISNTSTEEECPSKVKTVGLLFEDMKHLKVEGNGALLMYHGEMTTIAVENCQDIRFHNLHVDFERPAGSELEYTRAEEGCVEVKVHPDTRYEIVDGRMVLYGEGWKTNVNRCIEYDPDFETFKYTEGWNVLSKAPSQEVEPGKVRFDTPSGFLPKTGNVLTIRDIIRDQVGMFIYRSKDIELYEMYMHYMHGLGIVSQLSENITMRKLTCAPRPETGRVLASSADFTQFSGCKGTITIDSCYFSGAQDDPINIHGTNLRAVEKIGPHTINLRYMHGQTYGFQSFYKGDTIAFVKSATMERLAMACVKSVRKLSERVWQVSFDREIPEWLEIGRDCVENMTWTPEVRITNNYFTHTNTRGTLVSTPRKVVIENNMYYKTGKSAILIESDTEVWFESGPTCDVLIENNTFVNCAYNGGPSNAVIAVHPSNSVVDVNRPVHKRINIRQNTFRVFGNPLVYAKSTEELLFTDNTVEQTTQMPPLAGDKCAFHFDGCKKVFIKNLKNEGDIPGIQTILIQNMTRRNLTSPKALKVKVQ